MSVESQFVVRRLAWYQAPHGDRYTRRLPNAVAIAQFNNFDDAEYHRRTLEFELRANENPFRFGGAGLHFQSSLDIPRLHDWLLDMGIEPPVEQLRHSDWREWWDAFAHLWTEEQLHHAWQGLDKVRFFDVVKESSEVFPHLVMEIGFVETANRQRNAEREGGHVEAIFRNKSRASAACARLNAARREAHFDWWMYQYRQRIGYDRRPRTETEAVFFEVIEVPGHIPAKAAAGYIVQRRTLDMNGFICHDQHGRGARSRVPIRVFAEQTAAQRHRDELELEAREFMNPFQAYPPSMAGLSEPHFAEAIESLRPPLPWPTCFRPSLWREWWDLCQDEVTPGQRAAIWELFSNHPLFEVIRIDVRNE